MVNYTWEHLTPFTLGLDETFSRLEAIAGSGTNYPPYNIYNGSNSRTVLEVALAGFSGADISVETERNVLTISANKSSKEEKKYSHKGMSHKNFSRNWQLADDVEVESVEFKDGLLTVKLGKIIPDHHARKDYL